MKKLIALISFFLICTTNILLAHGKNDGIGPRLSELVHLEKQTVKNYKGYKFEVIWIDGSPLVEITQESKNYINRDIELRTVATIDPKKSIFEQTKTMFLLSSFKSFKAKDVVFRGAEWNKDSGETLLRFDTYDFENKLRMSQWVSQKNGFSVEEILFEKNGKPLNLTYYYGLKINTDNLLLDYHGLPYRFSLAYAREKFGPFNSDNFSDVVELCRKVLNRALSAGK